MTTLATHSEPTPQRVEVDEVDTDPDADEYDDDDDDDSEIIDHATFDQLLEMDDEEDHEFSKSLVWDYFKQAEKTFENLHEAIDEERD
ncbi:hypothetical protein BGX26_004084 [Mortierella sp. AD094]|nr:hypothetical protein BGX26_004084 [Mortierella sp. AD094]